MTNIYRNIIFFIPSIEDGGVEKNLFNVVNELAKKKINVTVITSTKRFDKKFASKIKIIHPNFFNDDSSRYQKYFSSFYELLKLKMLKKNFLLFSFQANFYSIIFAKIFNLRIIIRSNTSIAGWSKNLIKKFLYRIVFKKADAIIVNSKNLKKEFKLNFNLDTRMIYNPLDKKRILKLSKEKSKINFFDDKNSIKIINIGRLVDQKDQKLILKFISDIKEKFNIKLLIIGNGYKKNELKKYILENNLNKIVKIIKFNNNPFTYLIKSDLFILSSKYEGLPNVLLEALCLKKFVISSNCPTGPSEILKGNKGGLLFKVSDHHDLKSKFYKYINNKSLMKQKLKYGYKNLNRFNYKNQINKYFNLVEEFL